MSASTTPRRPVAVRVPRPGAATIRARRIQVVGTVTVAVIAALSAGAFEYPHAADWLYQRSQTGVFTTFAAAQDATTDADWDSVVAAAREYNADLLGGRVDLGSPEAHARYRELLRTPGTDVIAWLSVPSINASLPVYHGTDEDTLRDGVGHWYGSTLPVGGVGHSVLSAHSGLPEASLFTRLEEVEVGDTFTVSGSGQTLHYQVYDLATVTPDDVGATDHEAGTDRLTLVTCTPVGVNSHRLLVRAERIEAPDAADGSQELAKVNPDPGFPAWAAIWGGATVGAGALAWLVLMPPRSRPKPTTGSPDGAREHRRCSRG